MKKTALLLMSMLVLAFSINCRAAFPVKNTNNGSKTSIVEKYSDIGNNANSVLNAISETESSVVSSSSILDTHHGGGKKSASIDFLTYLVLLVLGIGFIGVGLNDHWEGTRWLIALILDCTVFFGWIYELLIMNVWY